MARLLASAGVTALVGSRVNWATRPQAETLPAVALHLIDGGDDNRLDGAAGLIQSRVQADCWGSTFKQAKQTARAVKNALRAYRGGIFRGIRIDSERSTFEDGEAASFHRTSLDLLVWHAEP